MKNKKYIITYIPAIFILIFSFFKNVHAENYGRDITVIDTPSAYTLGKGMYRFSFLAYDRGGLESKALLGLHDSFYLGASFDIQSALGKDHPEMHAPGVIAKLKFTDGWEAFPISLAIGYDSFFVGREGETYNNKEKLDRMVYGPYFVITKPIYIFDEEQHFNFGMRFPLQPHYAPEDTSYFVSLDVPIGKSVIFKTETERIYYDLSRSSDWLFSLGLKYSYLKHIGVEFDVLLKKDDRANRILKIDYNDEF